MRKHRTFSPEFKSQVVEELLSGISTSAQLWHRHHISYGLLYHWKKQYAKGRFGNEPTQEAAKEERVRSQIISLTPHILVTRIEAQLFDFPID